MKRFAVSVEICRVKHRADADALARHLAELVGNFPDAYVGVSEYEETPRSIVSSLLPTSRVEVPEAVPA